MAKSSMIISTWLQKILFLVLFLPIISSASGIEFYENIKKPFSGKLISYNINTKHKELSSRVVLTKFGVKLFAKGLFMPDVEGVYIQNFITSQSWLIDPKRRVFSEIPSLPEEESATTEEQVPPSFAVAGIMSTSPCLSQQKNGYLKRKLKNTLQQSAEQVWSCEYENHVVTQHFDTDFGIVIKEVWPSGSVTELINVFEVEYTEDFFIPPENYVSVPLKDLYLGPDQLSDFE